MGKKKRKKIDLKERDKWRREFHNTKYQSIEDSIECANGFSI
jgi:hypothetical protein